jgi:hypothetical protein
MLIIYDIEIIDISTNCMPNVNGCRKNFKKCNSVLVHLSLLTQYKTHGYVM